VNTNDSKGAKEDSASVDTTTPNSAYANSDSSNQAQSSTDTSGAEKTDTVQLGKAQDFTLVDLEGNKVSLSDFKGKKVFLNFWATWCPPCKAEMPEIEKVYQETKDSDVVILGVEIGEPLDTVKTFIVKNNYNFKVLLDQDQSVATTYGISAIPTSYFIDEEGNIISKRVGEMNYEDMKEYITKLEK
jgi:Peroxiredoxin